MAAIYLAMTALDFLSSMGRHIEGFDETNPFARHLDGSFWPRHALMHGSIDILGIVLLSAGAFVAGRCVNRGWARFCAGLPWLYFGWEHLEAALHNIAIRWGLYVPTLRDILG